MSVQDIKLPDKRNVRIYRADEVTERGCLCSATVLNRRFGNKLIGSVYLWQQPRDPKKLAQEIEKNGIQP
ncbi:hypothetical protein A2853_01965 [Candidatus Kaiserbacteria bacterium RIFCSPHIGHO2_01_FULL_55_17]|uniref:Uncharacterized protein n=1 Tax=Candidatus Kaiserbacteria bacterium RIFCSPHIGHO2_01_FULL_55_17 TaxID=1798484 RepID=A0A1F6D837_9BACT|nr:MAG: hypothetical protein A2853_01965 [Candidatus Kaiserbacteria bacterium RIFCSPHIGHO2_01_FULL_55_17]